nr:serine hydrolase [uncultured Carboxylicivirga sp.]
MASCTLLYREARYYDADITDYKIFPFIEVKASDSIFHFKTVDNSLVENIIVNYKGDSGIVLNDYLEQTSTNAFIIIRNDSILFEQYYKNRKPEDISTLFSVSKSITSLLVGVAIEDGIIEDIHDPITKYIPELTTSDPLFHKLTIEQLLNMRSGLHYNESYSNPFSHMARLYYGTNQLGLIKHMHFDNEPGAAFHYQSANTALLGIAIERASGKSLGRYLEEKVWQPAGMQYNAIWSLDDKRHQSAKAYGGLATSAIDLAKVGYLYLNDGFINGKQIVPQYWIDRSLSVDIANEGYQYQWWSFSGNGCSGGEFFFSDSIRAKSVLFDEYHSKYNHYNVWKDINAPNKNKPWRIKIYTDSFYALGIMHQILYLDPTKKLIMVRLGPTNDVNYENFLYQLSKQL